MSNEQHYDLEARIAVRLGEMDVKELRAALILFIVNGSVESVRSLAVYFNVPLQAPAEKVEA